MTNKNEAQPIDMSWLTEEVEFTSKKVKPKKNSFRCIDSNPIDTSDPQSAMHEIDALLAGVEITHRLALTPEQRDSRSASARSKPPVSPETCEKLRLAQARRREAGLKLPKATEQRREKIRQAHARRKAAGYKRQPISAEQKEKTRLTNEARKAAGYTRPPVTEETREKLRQAQARKKAAGYVKPKVSQDTREKMRQAWLIRNSEKKTPRVLTPEQREARSLSAKIWWAQRKEAGVTPELSKPEVKEKIRQTKLRRKAELKK